MTAPIPAGQRNQLVKIQRPPAGRDELGQELGAWTDVCEVWARARPLRGREFFAAGAMQSEATVAFGMNWRADVDSTMRVLWRGVPHPLVAPPIDVDGGRHTLELMCAAGVPDGEAAP